MPKTKKQKTKSKTGRQMVYIFTGMVVLFLVLLGFYFLHNSGKQFSFLGLNWDKEMFGQIPLFHAQVVTNMSGTLISQNLFFRNNPTSLELANFLVQYRNNAVTYIAVNDSIGNCTEGNVAIFDLGKFLASIGITAKAGLTDQGLAEKNNMSSFTCKNSTFNTVIVFQGGDKTGIEKAAGYNDCYIIDVNNCEMTKGVETLMINTIATAKGYVKIPNVTNSSTNSSF